MATNKKENSELRDEVNSLKSEINSMKNRHAIQNISSANGRLKVDVMFGSFYLTEESGEFITGLSALLSLFSNVTKFEIDKHGCELTIGFTTGKKGEKEDFNVSFVRDVYLGTWIEANEDYQVVA